MAVELSVTEARERFSEAIEIADREPVFLTRHGRRHAVLLSAERYESLLVRLEDAEDLIDADAAMAELEAGAPSIPWQDVKRDLGLA